MICGGARDECLAEVMLMLDILGMPFEPLSNTIYG